MIPPPSVTPFLNRDNFAKYLLLYYETGSNVLLIVFSWLYKGPRPYEVNLPSYLIANSKSFNHDEKIAFQKLKNSEISLQELDFSLLYKIIKVSCDVISPNDSVWGKSCPPHRSECLEQLLYKLKQGRNDLAHPSEEQKKLSDLLLQRKADEIDELLKKILITAGEKANISLQEVESKIKSVGENIEKICGSDNHDTEIESFVHQLIKEDLKVRHEQNLKIFCQDENKMYSKPTTITRTDHAFQERPVQQILHNFQDDKNILQIHGSAGEGKTTLCKYVMYSWLAGSEEFERLSSFNIVFLIHCEHLNTRSISEFLESELPTATLSFSNTSSFRRQLKASNTLWILDGFDQGSTEVKGFLREILEILSQTHKLLITLRSDYAELLNSVIPKKISVIAELGLLKDKNIEEIIYSLTTDEKQVETLTDTFSHVIKLSEKFRNPLIVKLFISLLRQSPNISQLNSMNKLYKSDVTFKLQSLAQRLELKTTALINLELQEKIQNWFDFLCYQSFLLLCRGCYGSVTKSVEGSLRLEANRNYLIASDCMSTFFPSNSINYEYSFLHLTQQYNYSAIYLRKALLDYDMHQHDLQRAKDIAFTDYDSRSRFLVHYRELILRLIWAEVEESDPLNVSLIMKAMDYSECEWSLRFAASFIEASNENEAFIQSVAKKVTEPCWYVLDDEITLRAASKLIEIIRPESIYLLFSEINTKKLQKIIHNLFNYLVTNCRNTQVSIMFSKYELEESVEDCVCYLPKIKKHVTKMNTIRRNYLNLNGFTGAVSDCSFLIDCCSNLVVLQLKLTTEQSFLQFLQLLNFSKKLQMVRVTIGYQLSLSNIDINTPFTYPKRFRPMSTLIFPNITNENYIDYVSLIRMLSVNNYYFNLKLLSYKFLVVSLPTKNLDVINKINVRKCLRKWVTCVNIGDLSTSLP